MEFVKWDHHKPIYAYTNRVRGFYLPGFNPRRPKTVYIPNKPYRNFGYLIYSITSVSSQTLITTGGVNRTFSPDFYFSTYETTNQTVYCAAQGERFQLGFGSATSPHDMSRYELYSPHTQLLGINGSVFIERTSTSTTLWTYHTYGFTQPSLSVGEVGLYMHLVGTIFYEARVLLARAIIDPVVEKYAGTTYEEGWRIDFPSNYTPALPYILAGAQYRGGSGLFGTRDRTGVPSGMRRNRPLSGYDIMIGSDNTPPSPLDYALKSPIGSLTAQASSIEMDTTLQEFRLVFNGSYTPASNVYLGEVGLFLQAYDTAGTLRYFLVARAVWDTPILLQANQTYSIGIVLRFA